MRNPKVLYRLLVALSLTAAAGALAADDVPDQPEKVRPILIGSKFPAIALKDAGGKEVSLDQRLANKPTILVYFRGGWCPFCSQQLMALGKKRVELERLGLQIIAVSADRPDKIRETQARSDEGLTILSDNTMAGARALGIAFRLPEETVALYKEKYKIDIERDSGMTHHILPVPSVFVLDAKGVVTFHYINPNYKVRLDEDILIAAAKAVLK